MRCRQLDMRESLRGIRMSLPSAAQRTLTPGAKQVVTAKGTPGDHHRVAGEYEAGLGHVRWTRTKRIRVPESDFNALRGLPRRIPSSAAADANEGGVVGDVEERKGEFPASLIRIGVRSGTSRRHGFEARGVAGPVAGWLRRCRGQACLGHESSFDSLASNRRANQYSRSTKQHLHGVRRSVQFWTGIHWP